LEKTQPDPEKKKNFLNKVKASLDDTEEQLAVISTFVRLGVVVWAGFIISLNYIEIPGLGKQTPKDITFVASIFTGALASFGLDTAKRKQNNGQSGAYQIIRVETPLKIIGAEIVPPKPNIDKKA
jgi:hypothetical protein